MIHEVCVSKEGEKVVIPIPEGYKDCYTLFKSDFYRMTGIMSGSFFSMYYAIPYNFWLRFCQYDGAFLTLFKICRRFLSHRYGLQILAKKIGYGLYIGHYCGTIVSPHAIIGNNVNLSQFSTIGAVKGKAAFIGDNVYIGPSVCVVGEVNIGSNSTIGAGAVVTKDVQPSTTVVGVPAKFLCKSTNEEYIVNKWKVPCEDY